MRVLLIEDEPTTAKAIDTMLTTEGFNVYTTDLGEEGLDLGKLYDYDIILLDLNLPDMHGYDVLKKLRTAKVQTPVLILSGISEMDSKVRSFGFGADDYVTKPFSPRVLIARIEAALRRTPDPGAKLEAVATIVARHGMEIHPGRHEVKVNGETVHLTASEFTILELLAGRPGWVFSRQQIIDQVRGYDYSITPRAVDVQIFGLRRKLGPAGACIETVRGIGYRLRE